MCHRKERGKNLGKNFCNTGDQQSEVFTIQTTLIATSFVNADRQKYACLAAMQMHQVELTLACKFDAGLGSWISKHGFVFVSSSLGNLLNIHSVLYCQHQAVATLSKKLGQTHHWRLLSCTNPHPPEMSRTADWLSILVPYDVGVRDTPNQALEPRGGTNDHLHVIKRTIDEWLCLFRWVLGGSFNKLRENRCTSLASQKKTSAGSKRCRKIWHQLPVTTLQRRRLTVTRRHYSRNSATSPHWVSGESWGSIWASCFSTEWQLPTWIGVHLTGFFTFCKILGASAIFSSRGCL